MRITSEHWISRVRRRESPHQDCRPRLFLPGKKGSEIDISLVVVHCISLPAGKYGTGHVDQLFCGELDCASHPSFADLQGVAVSSHLFIDRRGKLTQYVPFDARAWHAGESSWQGRPRCNDYAVGIELEGIETGKFTQAQYQKLARVLRALMLAYPQLCPEHIVGHHEIAPARKGDPGPEFDWVQCLAALNGLWVFPK